MKKLKLSTIIFAILILIGVYCCTSKKSKPKNQTPNKTYVISTKTENEKLTINIMMENPKDETKQKEIDKATAKNITENFGVYKYNEINYFASTEDYTAQNPYHTLKFKRKENNNIEEKQKLKLDKMESIERPLINPTTRIKNGTIPYIYTSKHLHMKESWQQLYNQLEESEYNQVIIRFTEDDTAFLINKSGFFVYGTFDKNTNFIGDSISDYWQDFPDFILAEN